VWAYRTYGRPGDQPCSCQMTLLANDPSKPSANDARDLSPGWSVAEPWISVSILAPALKERKRRTASCRPALPQRFPVPAVAALILLSLAFSAVNGLAETKGLEAAVERANRELNQGKLNEAEKQVDAAQKLYPDKPEVWNLRGAIFLKQRRLDDAAEQFAKALQLDSKFYAAEFNLAQVFLLQNKFDDAQARFQDLQAVDPKSELLQFKVVLCTVLKGQADQASTLIDTMTFPGETPAYYYARAAALLKRAKQIEARQYLTNARKYYPDAQCAFFDQELKQVGLLTPAPKQSPTKAAKP